MTEVSTRERAGAFDALETAKPGEPIFVLQGGDPHAPATVMFWAGLHRQTAMLSPKRDDAVAMLRKASNAEEVAWEMRDYQSDDTAEVTPVEAPVKAYSGVARDAERDRIAVASELADRIYNAVAELSEVADALGGAGGFAAAELKLRDAVIAASEGVKLVEPRRHLPRADVVELERVAAPDTMVAETFRSRKAALMNALPNRDVRFVAVRNAIGLVASEGGDVVMVHNIAFTVEEAVVMRDAMFAQGVNEDSPAARSAAAA